MADPGGQNPGILATLGQGVQAMNRLVKLMTSAFPQTTGTSGTATGGAATLPANPVGFIVVTLPDGTSAKIPYYT